MIKVTFMGAGSTVFARNVLGDCMCTPALHGLDIALYDIDPVRLEESQRMLEAINRNVHAAGKRCAAPISWSTPFRSACMSRAP